MNGPDSAIPMQQLVSTSTHGITPQQVGPDPKETDQIEREKKRQEEHEEQLRREQQKEESEKKL